MADCLALFDLLGLTFTPRIKDLEDQQLYRTDSMNLRNFPSSRRSAIARV